MSWRSPFNIDQTQFPRPWEIEVYRAGGSFGDAGLAHEGRIGRESLDIGFAVHLQHPGLVGPVGEDLDSQVR